MIWPPQVTRPHTNRHLPVGPIKTLIHTSSVDSEVHLIARIVESLATIRQTPGSFERTRHSLLWCCRLCIEVGGCMFQPLL
jgi:hypothetical protein